jgi:protein-S-isoprenylcysteine O-methyltransferase Ste14
MYFMRILGWLIAGIYATIPTFWMAVHPFAQRWRRRGLSIQWLGPWWVLLWIVAWSTTFPFRNVLLYDRRWPWLVSTVLWAISIYVYRSSVRTFTMDRVIGRHEIDVEKPQTLVTSGIYARVRNPLYSAHLCTVMGWAVGTGLAVAYACAAFYLVTLAWMLPREEQELRSRFGELYVEYARQVPRLIPRFFHRLG